MGRIELTGRGHNDGKEPHSGAHADLAQSGLAQKAAGRSKFAIRVQFDRLEDADRQTILF